MAQQVILKKSFLFPGEFHLLEAMRNTYTESISLGRISPMGNNKPLPILPVKTEGINLDDINLFVTLGLVKWEENFFIDPNLYLTAKGTEVIEAMIDSSINNPNETLILNV